MSAAGRLKVAVVFGGASTEHTVSVRSARAVLAAMDRERYEPLPMGITRDGVWLQPQETEAILAAMADGAPECVAGADGQGALARPQALESLATAAVVFPLVHGHGGEDGSLQGLLELAHLPYVGAGVTASAVGMDKTVMKALLERAGLRVAPFRVVTADDWATGRSEIIRGLSELGFPCFAKPSNGGSSVGISRVESREEFGAAVDEALRTGRKALVERAIAGRELECAVLGNAQPQASPVGEVRYRGRFYDYAAKYDDPDTELLAPAPVSEAVAERVQAMALASFRAIDCAGMARVDFFLEHGGAVWVNEINTIPGFTDVSMFPRLWATAGLPFPALIERLVSLALERHTERTRHERLV